MEVWLSDDRQAVVNTLWMAGLQANRHPDYFDAVRLLAELGRVRVPQGREEQRIIVYDAPPLAQIETR